MIIVDTSIAVKWLHKSEENREQALSLYESHLHKMQEIAVPRLFYIEAANVLATKGIISDTDIIESINFLFESHLRLIIETKDNITEAALLAKKYHTSVYDMLYAVIAKTHNTVLITADKRFVKTVNFSFVELLTA